MVFAGKYSQLQENASHRVDDDDLEGNESDTTKFFSTIEIYDKMRFLPFRENLDPSMSPLAQRRATKRASGLNNFWTWLRFVIIVGLQTVLILLLLVKQSVNRNWDATPEDAPTAAKWIETGGDINGLYKTSKYNSPLPLNIQLFEASDR